MALRQKHSASKIGAGRIALTIVFPRMPGRQILAEFNTGGHDPAEVTVRDPLSGIQQARVKAKLETHQNLRAASLGSGLQEFDPFRSGGDRLLQQDRAARFRRGNRDT